MLIGILTSQNLSLRAVFHLWEADRDRLGAVRAR